MSPDDGGTASPHVQAGHGRRGTFGTALAVLVFLFAAGRILLLLAAWTATSAASPVVTDPVADAHDP